ncbi:MAG: hypothetical protein ABR964_09120 [Tepidisphaeraceae bacterium]|jgi:hypothetical protein
MPVYIQIILSVAGVFVAACAVVVSVVQWRVSRAQSKLARQKLQFELFDRRMQVLDGLLVLADATIMPGHLTSDLYQKFHKNAFEQRFLFPPAVSIWIEEVQKKAWRYLIVSSLLEHPTQTQDPEAEKAERLDLRKEANALAEYFRNLYKVADAKLEPHLRIC